MNKKELDWLAVEIIATFENLGFDQAYVDDKRHSLLGRDRLAVLLWCHCLDARCLKALADRLGVGADDLGTTIKTLARL